MLVKYKGAIKLVYRVRFLYELMDENICDDSSLYSVYYTVREFDDIFAQNYLCKELGLDMEYIKKYSKYFELMADVSADSIEIIDSRVPPNWIFLWSKKPFHYHYTEMLHKGFTIPEFKDKTDELWHKAMLREGLTTPEESRYDFLELYENVMGYQKTLVANEMLAFHGLPPIEIPPDCYPEPPMTEAEICENMRLAKIDKELQKDLEYANRDTDK